MLISTILFGISLAVPLRAQTNQTDQEKKIEKVKNEIKKRSVKRDTVKVKLHSGTRYVGTVSQANDANFVITDKAGNA